MNMKKFIKSIMSLTMILGLVGCAQIQQLQQQFFPQSTSETTVEPEEVEKGGSVRLAVKYGVGHGDDSFAMAAVVVDGEGKILDVFVDEYQYMPVLDTVGVPNADNEFSSNYADDDMHLASRRVNAGYLKQETDTETIEEINNKIQDFAIGKNESEIRSANAESVDVSIDDVTNILGLVAETAYAAQSANEYVVADLASVQIKEAEYAAHGEDCFTVVVNVMEQDKVVTTYIDEFEYLEDDDEELEAVPNSDGAFGAGARNGYVLVSKKNNSMYYSSLETDEGEESADISGSLRAIENYVAGKTIASLKSETDGKTSEDYVGTIPESTLVDTLNYVLAVINASENGK